MYSVMTVTVKQLQVFPFVVGVVAVDMVNLQHFLACE
jgi:hypothetical protein